MNRIRKLFESLGTIRITQVLPYKASKEEVLKYFQHLKSLPYEQGIGWGQAKNIKIDDLTLAIGEEEARSYLDRLYDYRNPNRAYAMKFKDKNTDQYMWILGALIEL